ncbi:MAG: hypothetical protein GYA24_17665 [Candidatus Lokiarchaeota archaeon]|nr:hypothetical protein [Candidatus Lokiarchaeota archaeon]
MMEQSFEFKVIVEAMPAKIAPFEAAFPAALERSMSGGRELGTVTCKVAGPRKGDAMQIALTIKTAEEAVEGTMSIDFHQHASTLAGRGKFTWHATKAVMQGSRLVAAMEKSSFVKSFQKHVTAAMQEALVAIGCAPASAACKPSPQQAAKAVACPRCGYMIEPGTIKQGRCPFCKVKL